MAIAVPAAALLAAAGAPIAGAALLADAMGREFAARLEERIEPERLARPGATLRRFRTPIPLARLLHEASAAGLEAAGSVDLRDATGATARFISLRRDDAVVAALRVADGQTEVLASVDEVALVRDLAVRAIESALEAAAEADAYRIARVPQESPDRLRLAARREENGIQDISVKGTWEATSGLVLQVATSSHLPDGREGTCPQLGPFLAGLGLTAEGECTLAVRPLPPSPSAAVMGEPTKPRRTSGAGS
jgi:hypothetical protein